MVKRYLPHDYAHCGSDTCKRRFGCMRWLSAVKLMEDDEKAIVPWFAPNPEDCTHYIEAIDRE